jgi:phosphatidylinositol alpha-1,6-mannosyltransferase
LTTALAVRRILATPTLTDRGGGVATASRLVWRVCREQWHKEIALVSLPLAGPAGLSTIAKIAFGTRLARPQMLRQARWLLFAHLGPARIQRKLPAFARRPYGVILHGVEAWSRLPADDRRLLAAAHLRLTVSPHSAGRIQDANGDIGEVVPCPLALEPDDQILHPRPAHRPAGDREPIVVMVGRLNAAEAYKGHAEVIAAWPRVVAAHRHARLVIIGDGDDLPRLRGVARRHQVDDAVEFTGFVTRAVLRSWYERAAAFAMPSRGEGFGLVYLEAMAHALPCLGAVDDAASDVIVDGETGFLVRAGDVVAIADRLNRLLGDAAARQRMGQAGAARLASSFSYDAFRSRLVSLIETHLEPAS